MADNIMTCPHCGKVYKLIPLKFLPPQDPAQPGHLFQSLDIGLPEQPEPIEVKRSFWASDGMVYAIAGTFTAGAILMFGWYYEVGTAAGPVAVFAALAVGVGLHILKIVLHAPARPPKPAESVKKIKVEHWSEDNRHVILQEILDERITLDELKRVAEAVIVDGHNFSRPALCEHAGISQAKFWCIKREFERLNYAHVTKAKKTVLTPRAHAFLRKLASMEK